MPRITDIRKVRDRYWIYIDGQWCCPVRERTFPAMNLRVGQEITCEEVKKMEDFHWKQQYSGHWEAEQVRLDKTIQMIRKSDPRVEVKKVGFGTDTTEFIAEHPDESGFPDLEVYMPEDGRVVMRVEVSGTERMRGTDYWVRPDKIRYAATHDECVWLVLHYAHPEEKFVCIRPDPEKEYDPEQKIIRDSIELYVVFKPHHEEVFDVQQFGEILKERVDLLLNQGPLL